MAEQLALIDAAPCVSSAETVVPDWSDVGGFVAVDGERVLGGYGSRGVPVARTCAATCQRCKRLSVMWQLVLWQRFEHALDRAMYWLGPEPGPKRWMCAACEVREHGRG